MSYPQTTFQNVRFQSGGFWSQKRKDISAAALKYQLKVLKDTGRYDAFKLKWHPIYDDEPEIWPVCLRAAHLTICVDLCAFGHRCQSISSGTAMSPSLLKELATSSRQEAKMLKFVTTSRSWLT